MFGKADALDYIEANKGIYIGVSDFIWECAELSLKEFKSAGRLMEELLAEGFEVESGLAGMPTAFKGSFGSGRPVIGILGEYDALAGLSQEGGLAKRKPVKDGGPGHGCGHNCLGTGALAGAVGAKRYLEMHPEVSGTIIYLGCPGEEGKFGKTFMARAGVFDGLDCALTWHPYATNNIFSGSTLANICLYFQFDGVASHAAAAPTLGRSALDGAELMNVGIQFLREHMPDDARVHYAFLDAGGKAPNVVQESAKLIYNVRAAQVDEAMELAERVKNIARGAALMTDTKLTITHSAAASNLVPNSVIENIFQKNLEETGVPVYTPEEAEFARSIMDSYEIKEKAVDLSAKLSPVWKRMLEEHYEKHGAGLNNFVLPYQHWEHAITATTDVADVSWICPTSMFFAQCAAAKIPEHSWQYVSCNNTSIAHKGLIYAGKVLAGSAIDFFENPQLVMDAKKEFDAYMHGRKYRCPMDDRVMPEI